jgi:hypothetical protein
MLTFLEFVEIITNEQLEVSFLANQKTYYIRRDQKTKKLEYAPMEAVLSNGSGTWHDVDATLESPTTPPEFKDTLWAAVHKYTQAERVHNTRTPVFGNRNQPRPFSMSPLR